VIKNKPTSSTQTSTTQSVRPRTPERRERSGGGGGGGAAASDNEPLISIRQSTNSLLVKCDRRTARRHCAGDRTDRHRAEQQADGAGIRDPVRGHHGDRADAGELAIIAPRQQQSFSLSAAIALFAAGAAAGDDDESQYGGGVAGQPTQQPVRRATVALTGEPTTAEDIVAEQPQIAVLESTNSLLVNATPRQHAAIAW